MKKKRREATPEWQNKIIDLKKLEKKFRKILAATLLVIVAVTALGQYLMSRYTSTILNVYADQQDNYVQLVLDQINLQEEGTAEAIITNIIETLDSGNTHYWTLSQDEDILYIKNVLETDRYQGGTIDEFFDSATAEEFLGKLAVNRVTHQIVTMNGVRYVASGAIFHYGGREYTLCLLTDETVILDNNEFLSTRISMYIYVLVIMIMMLVVAMVAESLVKSREIDNNLLRSRIELLNQNIEELERQAKMKDSYDTRVNMYNDVLLPQFASKLDEKGVKDATIAHLTFETPADARDFLVRAMVRLDENVLRFRRSDREVILLFFYLKKDACIKCLEDLYAIKQLTSLVSTSETGDTIAELAQKIFVDDEETEE